MNLLKKKKKKDFAEGSEKLWDTGKSGKWILLQDT